MTACLSLKTSIFPLLWRAQMTCDQIMAKVYMSVTCRMWQTCKLSKNPPIPFTNVFPNPPHVIGLIMKLKCTLESKTRGKIYMMLVHFDIRFSWISAQVISHYFFTEYKEHTYIHTNLAPPFNTPFLSCVYIYT